MAFDKNMLTEQQANTIIGNKNVLRIQALNEFANKYGYEFLFHSTFRDSVDGIFSEGIKYPAVYTDDRRDDLLNNSSITEKDLMALENYVKKNNVGAKLEKLYDTYAQGTATVECKQQISAKELLEYNHNGGSITIVLFVSKRKEKDFTKQLITDEFALSTTMRIDPYLKRRVHCNLVGGEFKYHSEYFYPIDGIAFAFDRDNYKIKINKNYDETYYLEPADKKKVKKGTIIDILKGPEKYNVLSK